MYTRTATAADAQDPTEPRGVRDESPSPSVLAHNVHGLKLHFCRVPIQQTMDYI